jgi:hypothetical protein
VRSVGCLPRHRPPQRPDMSGGPCCMHKRCADLLHT